MGAEGQRKPKTKWKWVLGGTNVTTGIAWFNKEKVEEGNGAASSDIPPEVDEKTLGDGTELLTKEELIEREIQAKGRGGSWNSQPRGDKD